MQTTKLFMNGRSQAVRLPKAFRFEGVSEVFIERDGDRVILSPGSRPSIETLIAALSEFERFGPTETVCFGSVETVCFPEREQTQAVDAREGW